MDSVASVNHSELATSVQTIFAQMYKTPDEVDSASWRTHSLHSGDTGRKIHMRGINLLSISCVAYRSIVIAHINSFQYRSRGGIRTPSI